MARTFNADYYGQKTYDAGDMETCYDCHNGPNGLGTSGCLRIRSDSHIRRVFRWVFFENAQPNSAIPKIVET